VGLGVLGSIINCCGHPWAGSVVLGQGRVSGQSLYKRYY